MNRELLRAYGAEVLSFAWSGAAETAPPARPDAGALDKALARCLRLAEKSGRQSFVLLGLGSGALASALSEALPGTVELLVCTLDPASARAALQAGGLPSLGRDPRLALLADTSPWALLFLMDMAGITPAAAVLALNPEATDAERAGLAALQRTLSASRPLDVPPPAPGQAPAISAAAILRPDEPDLPGFFTQFPSWLAELCVLWDAPSPPSKIPPCSVPLRQAARLLEHDFSAQRQAMLGLCRSPWILYLDADETLRPGDWPRIAGLTAQGQVAGWHFPRLTFYPDQDHCRMGLGLWPDLQLRLFRRNPGLSFVKPVHERLTGLDGPEAVALDLPILHHTHLLKRPEAIRRKLASFLVAGSGRGHTLSRDYPHLPRHLLEPPLKSEHTRALLAGFL